MHYRGANARDDKSKGVRYRNLTSLFSRQVTHITLLNSSSLFIPPSNITLYPVAEIGEVVRIGAAQLSPILALRKAASVSIGPTPGLRVYEGQLRTEFAGLREDKVVAFLVRSA